MENEFIDVNNILEKCGLGNKSADIVLSNIAHLEEFYDEESLIHIYNYCLKNIEMPDILIQIIKYSDSHRAISTLNILLDLLLIKLNKNINNYDEDLLINLKVLCIKAIANYKDASTVSSILACMNNKKEHYKVRLACADALGRIGDRFAVRPLIDIVEDDEEKSVYLKESATFALGLLGDTSAIDPLIKILESKRGFLNGFSFLKEKIVESLGKLNINNKKVINALKNSLMDSSPMVRINAIEAIMNSDDENSIELIMPSLQDEDDDVKKNALIALYNLKGRDILDEVINLPIYSDFLKIEAKNLIDEYEEGDYE